LTVQPLMAAHPDNLPGPAELCSLGLRRRQAEVLALLMQGKTARQIASELYLSPRTVEKHIAGAYQQLGAAGRCQAVITALCSAWPN
jgi:DNA-binding NarL/FixJ family response regulator